MNFIETLNHWGEAAMGFAWPMLWQSSFLIVILFAIDFALRRRVRAAIGHGLWLVLLLKLALPPSLALPTGLGWWLRPASNPPPLNQPASAFVVAYDRTIAPTFEAKELALPALLPPRSHVSLTALALSLSTVISVVLLGWM